MRDEPEHTWESEGGAVPSSGDAEDARRDQDRLRRDPRAPRVGASYVDTQGVEWKVTAVALLEGTGERMVARYSSSGGSWVGLLDDWDGRYREVRESRSSREVW
jgi:hypothetical protein